MAKVIGIDLGTTNSVMAHVEHDQARIMENADGTRLTPSVVGLDIKGNRLVGSEARGQIRSRPRDTIYSVKRFMGRKFADDEIQEDIRLMPYEVREAANGDCEIMLGGKPYSPQEISAFVLEAIKKEAEEWCRTDVTHAVITVPAYFGQRQRDATREAAALAGLKVMRILEEPTAAALAYGLTANTSEPRTILIYDLGGGTFDVTVMLASAGTFMDMAKAGNNHLGGDNFDQQIIDYALEETRRQTGVDLSTSPVGLQLLKEAAERAKISLSRRDRVTMTVPSIPYGPRGQTVDVSVDLTLPQYEAMIRPFIDETIDLVHQAIATANYTSNDIDQIVVVGGSSATPLVVRALEAEFGPRKILRNINAMEAVAMGAAIQSAIIDPDEATGELAEDWPMAACSKCNHLNPVGRPECRSCSEPTAYGGSMGVVVYQSTPKPVGVQTVNDEMEIMVPAGTQYPMTASVQKFFKTVEPNQRLVRVPVYEGGDPVASNNEYLGEATGELPDGLAEGTEVAVSFGIDVNGIIIVSARVPAAPQVKIEASIDLRQERGGPGATVGPSGGSPDGKGVPFPREEWQQEAELQCGIKNSLINVAERYLTDDHKRRLDQLETRVKAALSRNDDAETRRQTAELGKANQENGIAFMVLVKEAMSNNGVATESDRQALYEAHNRLDRAISRGDRPGVDGALATIERTCMAIMQRDGSSGGGTGGIDIFKGLLGR